MSIDSAITAQAFQSIREALAAADATPTRARKRAAVTRGPEFERIKGLPYRDAYAYGPQLVDTLTEIFARHSGVRLFESQAIALYEIFAFNGFIGNITMGGGKTLISLLACAGERVPLLVMPAKLIDKTRAEMAAYARDWRIPGSITIVSLEKLSRVSHDSFLEDLAPTRVIVDEAHKLRNPKAAHRRIRRYLKKSKASLVAFSGTLIGESLNGWAHVASWALHQRSPAPLTYAAQTEWSAALKADPVIQPGALLDFGEDYRAGYAARVRSAPGCFITQDSGIPNGLEIELFSTALSDPLKEAIAKLESDWELPTGETLTDPLSFHRAARQLELGCYYRWRVQPPDEWREARLDWSRCVREIIRHSRHLDTERAVIDALEKGWLPEALAVLTAWRAIKASFTPTSECVWIDRGPVREIASRAREDDTAIVWIHHTEIGAAFVAEGVDYFGAGGLNAAGVYIEKAGGKTPICASIESNKEGRNLQHAWGRSIVAELPRGPEPLEQLIARLHRPGQLRDTVLIDVLTSTDLAKRAWLRVLERAGEIEKNAGRQRLLLGTHVNPLSDLEIRALRG